MALVVASVLAAAVPAGAAESPPVVDHCWWWPGETTVHWDRAYLLSYYRSNYVERVVVSWPGAGSSSAYIDGDTARATTPIFAQSAVAELFLGSGQTVLTNTADCVFH